MRTLQGGAAPALRPGAGGMSAPDARHAGGDRASRMTMARDAEAKPLRRARAPACCGRGAAVRCCRRLAAPGAGERSPNRGGRGARDWSSRAACRLHRRHARDPAAYRAGRHRRDRRDSSRRDDPAYLRRTAHRRHRGSSRQGVPAGRDRGCHDVSTTRGGRPNSPDNGRAADSGCGNCRTSTSHSRDNNNRRTSRRRSRC